MNPLQAAGLALLCVLVLNYVVMSTSLYRIRPVFVSIETLDLFTAGAIVWKGVPGFTTWPEAKYLLAVVVLFRTAWNVHIRREALAEDRARELAEQRAEVDARIDAAPPEE